eukprot:9470837-Pyramimonas_sp.AAC.1
MASALASGFSREFRWWCRLTTHPSSGEIPRSIPPTLGTLQKKGTSRTGVAVYRAHVYTALRWAAGRTSLPRPIPSIP